MRPLRLIFGLGNPGHVYEKTRHNIGARALHHLCKRLGTELKTSKGTKSAFVSSLNVVLAKSQTFMNLSGQSLQDLVKHYGLLLSSVLVIHDDARLDFGKMQWQMGGPQRGQNGLRSIVNHMKSEDFLRLRLGVANEMCQFSQPDYAAKLSEFVLNPFTIEEEKNLSSFLEAACEEMLLWIQGDSTFCWTSEKFLG